VDLFRELARRMGFEDACFRHSVDEMIDDALGAAHPWLEGITRERLEREGHIRLNFPCKNGHSPAGPAYFLPFAEGNFATPSGKAELYSQQLAAQGLDPVVEWAPPTESRHSPQARQFPLELLARKADNFLNSTFANLPSVQEMEDRELLEMSSADAAARGIRDGERVRVFNDRGEIRLTARVDGAVQPGVVSARLSWARLSSERRNINVLTSNRLTDMGDGATFYSTLVEVSKV
jgi:anaerobic selenocysteine-containing dehydrogenase